MNVKTTALTQDPLTIELRGADESGKRLFKYFVDKLNEELTKRYQDAIWWQPDSSNYPYRYFWMFYYQSEKRDFITTLNIKSKSDFDISFRNFNLLPDEQINKKAVRIYVERDVEFFAPLIAEHYLNIAKHLERGGKIRGG